MSIIGTQEEQYYVKEFISINEMIEKFYNIFQIQRTNIKTLAPELIKLQENFEPEYLRFINIKRFAIPIIGRISSGKSTFLNFLLGLNNILETNTNIATKFVCIIRYNQLLNEPKAYSVILEERKLKNNINENGNSNLSPKFNFEKGEELIGDIKKIISERNKLISETKDILLKKEDFFMIIEINSPIFNKDMAKYSEIFEFMDLPGLNEQDGEKNFFRKNILPIIAYNTKFAFFIFDCLAIKDKDTIEIYESFSNLLNENIENSFYILNKIDKATNNKEVEIENFKKYIHDRYNVDLNKNHFLGTNALLLSKETEKYNNFESYLTYKIIESKDGEDKNFIIYLKKEMEKDLNLKEIKLKNYPIPASNGNQENINDLIKDFNEQLDFKNFGKKLDLDNYLKLCDIFKKNNTVGKKNIDVVKEISDKLFSSIKIVTESFQNLVSYDKQLHDLMNQFTQNPSNNDFYDIMDKIKKMNDFNYSSEKINDLKKIIVKLGELEPDNNFIKNIIKGYDDLIEFINKDKKIRIAVLGLYSSGKSTILNCLIGKKILPTSSDECTRRGIIIRYHNKDDPELYKTKFIQKLDYYSFQDSDQPLCSGFKVVHQKLNELNKINDNFENSFYILKIKIQFFDDYLNDELKEKIELIDFPGLRTENNFYEEKIFNPLMKFTDGFIFINKNDLIKEKSNVNALKDIINRIDSRKFGLNYESFLFVLNNHENKELNIEQAKIDLDEVVLGKVYEKRGFWNRVFGRKKKVSTDLYVTSFNAKTYENYLNFREKIKDFKIFIENCFKEMEEEDNDNLLELIRENYYLKFINLKIDSQPNEEINNLYYILYDILKEKKNDVLKSDKKTCYLICEMYQKMKQNFKVDERYKKSNAEEFFCFVKTQCNIAKSDLDYNFKNIYINYIKNLVYTFELINLNLLGNNICRDINIDKIHKQIEESYEKYYSIISEEEKKNKEGSIEKIENYIKNIESFNDPKEEGKKVANSISESNKNHLNNIYEQINNFKKELEKIKSDFSQKIKISNSEINFNDSVLKHFYSKGHFLGHVGVGIAEGIGVAGLIYAGAVITGPIGWGVAIGIHFVIALGTLIYDKSKEKKTLVENMEELKKSLIIKYDGNEDKIKNIILKMKEESEKEIERFVDSQNSEFKGIKLHKKEYDKIYSDFKQIYITTGREHNVDLFETID